MKAAGKRLLLGLVVLCGVVAWGGLAYWCVASDRTPPLAAVARQFEPFSPLPAVTNAMRDFESYFCFRSDARKESFVGGYLAPGVQNGSASYKRRYMKDSTSGFFPMPVILDLYFNENDELVAITSSEGYALKLDETKWIPFDKIDDTPDPSPSDMRKEAVDLLKMIMYGPPKKAEASPVQHDATQEIPARNPTEGNKEGGAQ